MIRTLGFVFFGEKYFKYVIYIIAVNASNILPVLSYSFENESNSFNLYLKWKIYHYDSRNDAFI